MFRVGQLVVCVDDSPNKETGEPVPFVKRAVYGIEALVGRGETITCPFCSRPLCARYNSIALVNVDTCRDGYCRYWQGARFRPVATTDISWAHKLVADLPKSKTLIDS